MLSATNRFPEESIAIPLGPLNRAAVPVPFKKPGPSLVPANCAIVVTTPVPDRFTTLVAFPVALELTVSVAVRDPAETGANASDSEHEAFTAKLAQLPAFVKDVGALPPSAMLLIVRVADPVFVTVRFCVALVVPTI